jgi:hypothetical protein
MHPNFYWFIPNYAERNHGFFSSLMGLIKHNVSAGTDVVLRFEAEYFYGNTGDGRSLWIELCAYFQTGANTLNALPTARLEMFAAWYDGSRRRIVLHKYVHLHQSAKPITA